MKVARIEYDPAVYDTAAASISDRIFMCFPAGFSVGLIAGTLYASFNWHNLQQEFGRAIVIGMSVGFCLTYWLCCRVIRRITKSK